MVPGDSHCLGRNREEILPISSKSCSNSADTMFLEVKVFDLLKVFWNTEGQYLKKLGGKLTLQLQRPRPQSANQIKMPS